MERREFLTVGCTGVAITLSGCADQARDALQEAQSDLEILTENANTTAFGNVEIDVEVHNQGSKVGSATLWGQVDVEGGETYEEQMEVSVEGGETKEYTLGFDISISDSLSSDSYTYQVELRNT